MSQYLQWFVRMSAEWMSVDKWLNALNCHKPDRAPWCIAVSAACISHSKGAGAWWNTDSFDNKACMKRLHYPFKLKESMLGACCWWKQTSQELQHSSIMQCINALKSALDHYVEDSLYGTKVSANSRCCDLGNDIFLDFWCQGSLSGLRRLTWCSVY